MGAECPCDRGSDPSPRGWASIAGRRWVAPRGGPPPPVSMGSGPPAPPPRRAPGLLGGDDSGPSYGKALASGTPHTSVCSDRTWVRSPGTFVTLHKCQTRAVGLVFPAAYGGRAEQGTPPRPPAAQVQHGSPAGRGRPWGLVGACVTVSSRAPCPPWFTKGEVSPGDGWAWALDRTLQGANRGFPEQCLGWDPQLPMRPTLRTGDQPAGRISSQLRGSSADLQ